MDIEKLIEKLRTESLYKDKATLEIMDLCMEAADAIEQLQTTVEQAKWDLDIAYDLANKNARLFDEMQIEWDERGEGCWWCNGIGATPENWECSLVGEFGTVTTADNEVIWTTASFCPRCGRRIKENEDG